MYEKSNSINMVMRDSKTLESGKKVAPKKVAYRDVILSFFSGETTFSITSIMTPLVSRANDQLRYYYMQQNVM